MVKLFRTLVIAAVALMVIAVFLPLGHSQSITISFNKPLPLWVIASMAMFPLGIAVLVSAGGLLYFKRWARWLGVLVAACSVVLAILVVGSPFSTAFSMATGVLLALAFVLWVIGLVASCHPAVLAKFQHVC